MRCSGREAESCHRGVEELDAAFPDGRYWLDLDAPSGRLSAQRVEFSPGPEMHRVPEPVTISLAQEGSGVALSAVDPDKALTVRWSELAQGHSDPNGVVDDLIFVILTDCHGEIVSHSGRPFAGASVSDLRGRIL